MTHVDDSHFGGIAPLEPGRIHNYLDRIFDCLKSAGRREYVDFEGENTTSEKTPAEQRLAEIQKTISAFSMYLPEEFAPGLGRQFANMLDEDAWEGEDDLPSLVALRVFLNMLKTTRATRRPGIGTNGRGSITAFWRNDGNGLTVDCLRSGEVAWTLSATNNEGAREYAAGDCSSTRLLDVLEPYHPRSWFDQHR